MSLISKPVSKMIFAAAIMIAVCSGHATPESVISAMKSTTATQPSNSFMVRNVRVFNGEEVHENIDVLIIDGMIEQLGVVPDSSTGLQEYSKVAQAW